MDPNARPRLLPAAVLLRRSPDELQIGLDPGWRVPDPAGRWQRALARLDGRRRWAELATEVADLDGGDTLTRMVASLETAGLVALAPPSDDTRVELVGADPFATTLAERLHQAGVLVERVQPESRWDRARSDGLVVVIAMGPEVDRALPAELLRRDAAHLLVRLGPSNAVIGPLVEPGRTPCLHCTDLTRRDADPAWPRLLGQLARSQPTPPTGPGWAIRFDWAVGVAAAQVLARRAGQRPESVGATLELAAPAYRMIRREWAAHPECGCRWLGAG